MLLNNVAVLSIAAFCMIHARILRPEAEQRCFEPVSHYSDLGCTPVYSGKCPERYDCPDLNFDLDHTKCYYKSKLYNLNETVTPYNNFLCPGNCVCEEDLNGGRARFNCTFEECPPNSNMPFDFGEECIFQRRDCCSFEKICGEENLAALKTCEWNNQTYKEGDMIRNYDNCQNCRCGSENNESEVKMRCSKRRCESDIEFAHFPFDGCAPVYYSFDTCCPNSWMCPEEGKDVVVRKTDSKSDLSGKCTYGNNTLSIGDIIKTVDKCLLCKCTMPPLVTCMNYDDCYKVLDY